MTDYREELELAIDHAKESMTPEQREALSNADWCLHYGPAGGGTTMSFGDALAILRTWADSVYDVTLTEFEEAEDGEEYEIEVGTIDAKDTIASVIGRELASYL
jgi:hypothetical protein